MSDGRGEEQQKRGAQEQRPPARTSRPARPDFRYYIHDGIAVCRLQLIGELTEREVDELSGCWRTARTTLGTRRLILDLHALRRVDEAGKRWLAGMAQEGATYSPERYLRDLEAGKHSGAVEAPPAAPKAGIFGRILACIRGAAGVEAAK